MTIVLITPDHETGPERYVLKRVYADAVLAAGGLPWIPTYGSSVEALLDRADALVVTGGAFDIPPESYGEAPADGLGALKPERTAFERTLLEGALERRLPVLGVCGGMQLLNVVRGGSLYQDIGSEFSDALRHEQAEPPDRPSHPIEVLPGSRLAAAIGGADPRQVNSTHHQAVDRLGRSLVVSAKAPDGVVEAIEDPSQPFVVGVQWHPEALVDHPWNLGIYRALVAAAR